jgi:hypothetical protein
MRGGLYHPSTHRGRDGYTGHTILQNLCSLRTCYRLWNTNARFVLGKLRMTSWFDFIYWFLCFTFRIFMFTAGAHTKNVHSFKLYIITKFLLTEDTAPHYKHQKVNAV